MMNRSTQPRTATLTVECNVRAPLLFEPVDASVETLRRAEERGSIDALVMRTWPGEISLEANSPDQEVVERFERFERWATEHDLRIRPPFRTRTSRSLATGETRRILVTPVCSLGLYTEGQLLAVFPHTDGTTTRTTTEAIGALRTGELPRLADGSVISIEASSTNRERFRASGGRIRHRHRSARPVLRTCPQCDGAIVNVQGILTCGECPWSDSDLGALGSPQSKLVYLALLEGPVGIQSLKRSLDMRALALYRVLATLEDRGLIERTEDGRYRARRSNRGTEDHTKDVLRVE